MRQRGGGRPPCRRARGIRRGGSADRGPEPGGGRPTGSRGWSRNLRIRWIRIPISAVGGCAGRLGQAGGGLGRGVYGQCPTTSGPIGAGHGDQVRRDARQCVEVAICFRFPDRMDVAVVDQYFAWPREAVVSRRLREAVRASVTHNQKVTWPGIRQRDVLSQRIPRLAQRPDDFTYLGP